MDKKIIVFISSRFSEFRKLRDKIIEKKFSELNIIFELNVLDDPEETADSRSPLVASLEEAENSDIFVLLLGETYGTVPPNYFKSYTHLEYDKALEKGLKILAFAIGDSYNEPIAFSENDKLRELQKAVCLNNRHITKMRPSIKNDKDIEKVYKDILKALTKELINTHKASVKNQKKNRQLSKRSGDGKIVGREKEFQEIEKSLRESNTLLVQGIGGIGKSTLASYYLHGQKRHFDYYGFFESVDSFYIELISALQLERDADMLDVLNEIRRLEGDIFFVIDDVQKEDDIEGILGLDNCQILFTSRYQLGCKTYDLNTLASEEAEELFLLYHKTQDLDRVKMICSYLDNHAFFVELVAKTIESQGYSLSQIIEKFNNGELTKIEFIDGKDGDKSSFTQNLHQLFSLQKLIKKRSIFSYTKEKIEVLFNINTLDEDDYILLLKRLSVLPSIEIEYQFLEEIFEDKALKGKLNFLIHNGWLIQSGNKYKFHQIMKEYILENHSFSYDEVKKILFYFFESIFDFRNRMNTINYQNNLVFFNSISNVLDKLNKKNYNIAIFFHNLGLIYHSLGYYEKVELLYIKSRKIYEEILNQEHTRLAIVYKDLGNLYRDCLNYEKAEIFYMKAIDIQKKTLGERHPDIAMFYLELVFLYNFMGAYEKLDLLYKKALNIEDIDVDNNDLNTTARYNNIALLYNSLGHNDKVEVLYKKALEREKKLFGDEHENIIIFYSNLAFYYSSVNQHQQAKPLYIKIFKIRKKTSGKNHLLTARACFDLGSLYYNINYTNRAICLHKIALKIRKDLLGDYHLLTSKSYIALGRLYIYQNNYLKTRYCDIKALRIGRKLLGVNHIDIVLSYKNLGVSYRLLHNYKKAELYLQKSLIMVEKLMRRNHTEIASISDELGLLYGEQSNYINSLRFYHKALKVKEELIDKNYIQIAQSYDNLGVTYNCMGVLKKAEDYHQKALRIRENLLGQDNFITSITYIRLGLVYRNLKEYEQAKDFYMKALKVREELLGKNHLEVSNVYNELGLLFFNMKDFKISYTYAKKALTIKKELLPPNHPDILDLEIGLQKLEKELEL